MSENILYKFAQDLSQLYAKTRIKAIEQSFIRVAQVFEEELENWLLKANHTNIKASLQNPSVFDAIITLARIRKSHAAGITRPEFIQLAMGEPSILRFLPLFLVLKDISNTNNFAVLNPFKGILASIGNAQDTGTPPDVGSVTNSVRSMDGMFREYLEELVEKSYSDDSVSSKKKPNKKEKIMMLLRYLSNRFANELSMAFEERGKIDTVGFAHNINNPQKIIQIMYPNFSKVNISYLVEKAKTVASKILKTYDAEHYDYAYNMIKAEVMHTSSMISKQQFEDLTYNLSMRFQDLSETGETINEQDLTNVPASSWIYSQNIVYLSIILYLIGSKAK